MLSAGTVADHLSTFDVAAQRRDRGPALHNHMLGDDPRLVFMHFWANDDAKNLAAGLKAALSHIAIVKG